jgi:hypothetical protein
MKIEVKHAHRNIPDEALIEDLRRVAKSLGRPSVTAEAYGEHGRYSSGTLRKRFGSWNEALARSGIGSNAQRNVDRDTLLWNLMAVWIKLGRQPHDYDMRRPHSKFSVHLYKSRFGTWSKALEVFEEWLSWRDPPSLGRRADARDAAPAAPTAKRINRKTKRETGLRQRFRVMLRDEFRCRLCGRSPATHSGMHLEIDHVVPWSKGGETTDDNLQTLCSDCNRGKWDSHEDGGTKARRHEGTKAQ